LGTVYKGLVRMGGSFDCADVFGGVRLHRAETTTQKEKEMKLQKAAEIAKQYNLDWISEVGRLIDLHRGQLFPDPEVALEEIAELLREIIQLYAELGVDSNNWREITIKEYEAHEERKRGKDEMEN